MAALNACPYQGSKHPSHQVSYGTLPTKGNQRLALAHDWLRQGLRLAAPPRRLMIQCSADHKEETRRPCFIQKTLSLNHSKKQRPSSSWYWRTDWPGWSDVWTKYRHGWICCQNMAFALSLQMGLSPEWYIISRVL